MSLPYDPGQVPPVPAMFIDATGELVDPVVTVVVLKPDEPAPRALWQGPTVAGVPQPASGTDFAWKGPEVAAFKLLSLRAVYTASAVVASRVPHLQAVTKNGEILIDTVVETTITAGNGVRLIAGGRMPWWNNFDGNLQAGWLDIWLPAGTSIRTVTTALAAGDQWSAIVISYLLHGEGD